MAASGGGKKGLRQRQVMFGPGAPDTCQQTLRQPAQHQVLIQAPQAQHELDKVPALEELETERDTHIDK